MNIGEWLSIYTIEEWIAWITVAVGLLLGISGVHSTFYFGRQHRLLKGNWVTGAIYRTVASITIVCLWLTLSRAITLNFGRIEILSIIGGIAVIWLLLIPRLLYRYFVTQEGKEALVDRTERGQTLVEYGLLLALIAVVVIVALVFLGPIIADLFSNIGERVTTPAGP